MGNLSVSTPVTGITVSRSGAGAAALSPGCWARKVLSVALYKIAAVSKAVFRIEVSFRNNGILLGRDSSDRLRCF